MSDAVLERRSLPVGSVGTMSVGWWGVLCLIATEASLFLYLFFAYFYYQVQLDGNWITGPLPSLRYSLPAVIILIVSSSAVGVGQYGLRKDAKLPLLLGFGGAFILGLGFIVLQGLEWSSKPFGLRSSEYSSVFYTITGVHIAHLIAGVITLAMILIWSALGYFSSRRNAPVLIAAAYWHFVVAAGVAMFFVLYVTPYIW